MYCSYCIHWHAICTAERSVACVLQPLVTCQALSRTMLVIIDGCRAITRSPFKVKCSNCCSIDVRFGSAHVTSLKMCCLGDCFLPQVTRFQLFSHERKGRLRERFRAVKWRRQASVSEVCRFSWKRMRGTRAPLVTSKENWYIVMNSWPIDEHHMLTTFEREHLWSGPWKNFPVQSLEMDNSVPEHFLDH